MSMLMLRSRKKALDPSEFEHCFQIIVIKSGKCDFNLFQQQYASEIIAFILEELCVELPHAQDILRTIFKNQVFLSNCYQVLLNEESTSILYMPVAKSLQTLLNIFFQSEKLTELDIVFL